MSPLLGIWASSIQGSKATSFDSIATVTVGAGGSSSITFSSIPSTYKHLQLRYIARSDRAVSLDSMDARFNGATSTSTSYHGLLGDGASASAYSGTITRDVSLGLLPGSSASSSTFGASVVDILDYSTANKNRVTRTLNGQDFNGSGQIRLVSGAWYDTTAINQIVLVCGGNFVQYSTFALYGIK